MRQGVIGHVVGVHGPRVKVELAENVRSAVRAGTDGARIVVAINSYLTFELGAGDTALGVVTDLEARERWDPAEGDLTLELVKPRRVATLQLLGTVRSAGKGYQFDPGITILPTLDTPAETAASDVLKAVFSESPRRNVPPGANPADYDGDLVIGRPVGAEGQAVVGSFNDLFSRPLAVVGNTGSGKSCTIAHLVQEAARQSSLNRPHFFILDINGEYADAFGHSITAQPNKMYVNGQPFGVPLWLMNAREVCEWLSASEQTQEPVLKNVWSLAKGGSASAATGLSDAHEAIERLNALSEHLRRGTYKTVERCRNTWAAAKSFLDAIADAAVTQTKNRIGQVIGNTAHQDDNNGFGASERQLRQDIETLREKLLEQSGEEELDRQESADQPRYFSIATLNDPTTLFRAASSGDDDSSIDQFLRGLRLRLRNRLLDARWEAFRNYDDLGIRGADAFAIWLSRLGIGCSDAQPKVTVIDFSMIAADVLPYACGIVGRLLLELREHANPGVRFQEPWVIVLEEAHNYVRPRRQIEDRGLAISREAFERIAKEGRKFGLSLIVASQRPSEISPTVLSQCANFIMHRLQNPDDIEHFRSIVPSQSRRLLDQATVLGAGEGIVLGSAFHVPARVRVNLPEARPSSRSSTPHRSWRKGNERFGLESALKNWLGEKPENSAPPGPAGDLDDEIPF
jgi:hypothetical protein